MSVPRSDATRWVNALPPFGGGLALALVESGWLGLAQSTARLPGDHVPAMLAVLVPTLATVAVGVVAGAALARWRGTAAAGGWASLLALAVVPLSPGWSPLTVPLAWLVLFAVADRWAWVGPLGVVGLGAATVLRAPLPGGRVVPVAPGAGSHVVLVTLDTFRADHVGAIGGYRRVVRTPQLDALAAQGALFDTAIADVPLTGPSHVGLLTGRPPWELGVVRNGDRVSAAAPLVSETLRRAGYRTGAFVSARVLGPEVGLDRGFDHYDHHTGVRSTVSDATAVRGWVGLGLLDGRAPSRRGDTTVGRALAWLGASPEPAFLWVHLYDPHAPYDPPRPFADAYDATAPDAPGHPAEVEAARAIREAELGGRVVDFLPADLRHEIADYAGEISWTDDLVGRLLQGLPDDARVVVVADHGESLTEHGYLMNHGASVHEPSVRVPVWVRGPGYAPGRRVEAPVPARRVAATLRALAGVDAGGPTLADPPSPDWIASVTPGQQSRFDLRLHRSRQVALRQGSTKWIVDEKGAVARYDLGADPGELNPDVDPPDADAVVRTARMLFRALDDAEDHSETEPGLEDALRALGYAE